MYAIKVTLIHSTPLHIASDGARTCWASQDKSDTELRLICDSCGAISINTEDGITNFEMNIGDNNQHECNNCRSTKNHWESVIGPKDLALIDRVGNQYHHSSILEHVSMNFFIDGVSRACLQEISRHRMSSLSVKSSRYTISELRKETPFTEYTDINDQEYLPTGRERAEKYLVMTTDERVNRYSILALDNLRDLLAAGISNDVAKYALPEAYRTQLTWTINLRSLQNFLTLRTSKKALPEIQHLAHLIYESLPADIQSLVSHCVDPVDELAIAKARIAELESQLGK